MSNNETKDKRRQEQLFYLQLKHTHDNDFESMLSHEEKRLWAMFSDGHKRLFGLSRDWEWLVKCSLQRFTDAEKITRCSDWAEVAQMRFNYFRKESQSCKKIMAVDDLTDFLFPFLDLEGEQLRSELIEQIKYESVIGPEAHPEKYTREWEVYGVNCVEIRLKWLESRDSDYLKSAAAVWRGYLEQGPSVVSSPVTQNINNSPDGLPIPWLLVEAKRVRKLPGQAIEAAYRLFRKRNGRNHKTPDELFELLTPEDLPEFVKWRNDQKILKAIRLTLVDGVKWDYQNFLVRHGKVVKLLKNNK